jgi:selenocysteine-specific elongation factor
VQASGLPPAVVSDGLARLKGSGLALSHGSERDPIYLDRARHRDAAEKVLASLSEFHESKPLSEGLAKETLKKKALASWDARSADMLIDGLAAEGKLESDGSVVRLPGSRAVTGHQQEVLEELVRRIASSPVSPPTLSELAGEMGLDRSVLSELLAIAEKDKRVVRVSPELYFSPSAISDVLDKLKQNAGPQGITVSDFKNLIRTSRKYALPLLEYFDRTRVTARVGDLRKLR